MYIIYITLVFLFFFGAKTPLGVDVSVLCNLLFLSLTFFLVGKKYYMPKIAFYFFVFLLVDLIISLIYPIVKQTYDFGFVQTKTNVFVSLLNIYNISYYLYRKNIKEKQVIKLLLVVFSLQSILILYSLLNPDFAELIASIVKSEKSIERMMTYGGARGLGFTSYSAFGLAIIMSLSLIILFYSYYSRYISKIFFIVLLPVFVVASLSAGRSAIIGLILSLLIFNLKKRNVMKPVLLLFAVAFLYVFLYKQIDSMKIESNSLSSLYSYLFEPISNFYSKGKLTTSSTDGLYSMYFPLTPKQFFIGDARYLNPTGGYYLHTDAGYMRFCLYYGAFFSMAIYVCFIAVLYGVYKKVNSSYQKKTLLVVFFMSFILHYKGEVVLFALGYNKVLFFVLFTFMFNKRFLLDRRVKIWSFD